MWEVHHIKLHIGWLLTVEVRLGNVKLISPKGLKSITFTKLLKEGYDSVEIPRGGGTEYVVYNWDQCELVGAEEL